MRSIKRKQSAHADLHPDPRLTLSALHALKDTLKRLKTTDHPRAVAEMQRLAEDGDFSENAAYQIAKGKVRGINNRILQLEHRIKRAVLIRPSEDTNCVEIGHKVTVEVQGKKMSYRILGSSEANPGKGVISANSPIGEALLGKRVGERAIVNLPGGKMVVRVLAIGRA